MDIFDFADTEFKIDVGNVFNSPNKSWYDYTTKNVVIMATHTPEIEARFKAFKKETIQSLSFVGKECLLQGSFIINGCYVKKGRMGKVVTLHLISDGYTLSHGMDVVRKFFIDNALRDIE